MSENTGFDRDFDLGELIGERDADELCRDVAALLGGPAALLDEQGHPFGTARGPDGASRTPLVLELEPLAYLLADGPPAALAAVARLVRWGLMSRARMRMVSDLHLEAVRSDYAKLQQQNQALRESEVRLRELAASLDAKVQEQAELIGERQRQLYQAERLASIGQLAAGVAHEINNPLGFINSNLSAAQRYLGTLNGLLRQLPPELRAESDVDFVLDDFAELLAESANGVSRIARIVQDLKGFSSVDQPEAQLADINRQLESLLAVMAGQKPAGVTLETDFGELPQLMCLPGHLNQAFLNVLHNAMQAAGEHGAVRLRTRLDGERIRIEIEDDGPGIAEDVMPYVFDPFYTTRGVGGGTGLGLTVARDVVLAHDGTIGLENRAEGGLRVVIELPQ